MGDWREATLGELFEFSSGLSKPRSEFGAGYPFLSFKDVFYNTFVPAKLTSLVKSDERERERCSVSRGDVFLTRTSETMDELGMSCVALRDVPNATFNGFTKRLRPKTPSSVVPEYAGYYFKSPRFRLSVNSMSSMSTRASLNNEMLARLKMTLPPLRVQEAIGSTLKALDDKIELNRRMNETLEATARAIFKDWFVDFGPTRAKMEGRAPYLAADIWSLFPDTLGQDGKPEGWEISTIGHEVDVFGGSTPSTKEASFWAGDIAWATPKDLSSLSTPVLLGTERQITETGLAQIGSGLLPVGTVLLSSRAPIGYLAIAQIPVAVNQGFIAMVCAKRLSNVFVWLWTQANMDTVHQNANGSTFQEISKANFRPIGVTVATPEILRAFDEVAMPIFGRIVANEKETRTLAATRDLLLPKLMSGDVRVKDAESLVGEAT